MRGRKILAEFIIVDNDFLSYMTIEAVKYNPTAMDSIFIPGTTVVVTSTIYEEATFGAATNEYSAFRKTWLDRNIASGKVILQLTPEYPSGVDDMGELSMIAVGTLVFNGQSVTYVSNDNFFTQMGGYGFNLVNLIPGQTHNTGQGLLYKSLLEGGMSLIEYQVSSFNLFDESSEEPIFTEGGSAIGSNGTILFLTPAGLVIRQANGDETYLSPAERFRINSDGNVEVLGIFNPTDGSVIPPDDYCFLAGTPILLTNRQSKPVESIIPGDLVQSYDASGRLVPGRVTRTFRNEVYVVDATTDVIIEAAAGGIDTVQSSITLTLMAELENLILTGAAAINGAGNAGANILTGNTGANSLSGLSGDDTISGGDGDDTLDGGAGTDSLTGGAGNDTYLVDVATDVLVEAASGGVDTVQSLVTYTLGAELENLTLLGTAVINGTGNAAANNLTGNSATNSLSGLAGDDMLLGLAGNDTILGGDGNDSLDGGVGTDSLTGGAGNDIYVVDATTDVIVETVGGGLDTVQSSVTFTLATELENLTLLGTSVINGTGNAGANSLTGTPWRGRWPHQVAPCGQG
jgi:RTX calcium-binding nonapeptide repeat (4 copies)